MIIKSTRLILIGLISITINSLNAQDLNTKKYTASNKGKFTISWGGNRESYS